MIYASFDKEDDYPGLSLLEGLEHVTKEKRLKNFSLVKCHGENSTERWNEALIDWELKPYSGQIARIYVAGSPTMSQVFDRSLSNMVQATTLKASQVQFL